MRRRILSLFLAFALVLGMVPMVVSADETSTETNSVTVHVSLSKNAEFMVGAETSKVMAMVPVTVPYFDLANYGLEKYYFVSETYEGDGSGGPSSNLTPGTSEYAAGKVTLLHLYIYITEVFYYGEPAETAGSGYLKEEGLLGNTVFDIQGETGSAFLSQFWDGGYNLQYYVNHVYPLASNGWGSTCDQILLHDGDIVTLGNFTSMDFYNDSTAVFNYIKAEDDQTSVTYGEELKISILRAGKDPEDPSSYNTVSLPVTSCPSVYYCPVNDVPNKSVTEWEYLGKANEDGSFTLDTQKLPASDEDVTYMIAIPGQYGSEYPDAICSTPGGMLLTVVGDKPEAPPVNYGDVNGDSSVDASDVSLVAQYVANLYKDIDTAAADVDNSGSIDASDVSLIAQYVAHLLDALPVGSANS